MNGTLWNSQCFSLQISYFSVAVLRYPDESNLQETGLTVAQFLGPACLGEDITAAAGGGQSHCVRIPESEK